MSPTCDQRLAELGQRVAHRGVAIERAKERAARLPVARVCGQEVTYLLGQDRIAVENRMRDFVRSTYGDGMHYIIVDVEATCWGEPGSRDQMEIIEIGAVRLDERFEVVDEFDAFVRPVAHPALSTYCTELTSITQAEVDAAAPFSVAFPRFLGWIGKGPFRVCSWGFYDVAQFRRDCTRHSLSFPEAFETDHINLKNEFARWQGTRRCGMARALAHMGFDLDGTHHRGIDDARNIARIARQFLSASAETPADERGGDSSAHSATASSSRS